MLIVGAGGLALQLIDSFEESFGNKLVFWENIKGHENVINKNYKTICSDEEVIHYFKENGNDFIIAIGGAKNRLILSEYFANLGGNHVKYFAPSAQVSKYAVIEEGVLILNNAMIEASAKIGEGSLINVGALITHECVIGQYVEVAPGVVLGGHVMIGNQCFIGLNATILPKLSVASFCLIGAGAIVTKSISEEGIKVKGISATK